MAYVICATRGEAVTLAARLDAAFGWPRVGNACQATKAGTGFHVTHPLCCTQRHVDIIQHPTLSLWAVGINDGSRAAAGPVTEVALTGDWSRI